MSQGKKQNENPKKNTSTTGLVILAFAAFISLGLPDGLLGVAWPGMARDFGLPLDALGGILVFFTTGYMLSSFFNGLLLQKLGVGGLLALSCTLTGGALLVYGTLPLWWALVLVSSFLGVGAGAIDAGINTYVAQNYSESLMHWLHASFGIGITLGPFIMTLGISWTTDWQPGYVVVALGQLGLALVFYLSRKAWLQEKEEPEQGSVDNPASLWASLGKLPVILSILLFFLYTGIELGLGIWAYTLLTQARGVEPALAGIVTGSYWGMFTLGRILAGFVSMRFKVLYQILGALFMALLGVLLVIINLSPVITVVGIGITGFALAPIFPGLVADTADRVGTKHQANTIGMQIAAAGLGGAVLPSVAGFIAQRISLEGIPYFLMALLVALLVVFAASHKGPSPKL